MGRSRGRCRGFLAWLALGCASCGSYQGPRGEPPAQEEAEDPGPPLVNVTFVSALISPAKQSGCQWDGLECNEGDVAKALAQVTDALGQTSYKAVLSTVAIASQALEQPDPGGVAVLFLHGHATSLDLEKKQDSFTPTWNAEWDGVPLDRSLRLRVTLVDRDLRHDDDMGSFEVPFQTLEAAHKAGRVAYVHVAEQTYNQVLLAGISVFDAE